MKLIEAAIETPSSPPASTAHLHPPDHGHLNFPESRTTAVQRRDRRLQQSFEDNIALNWKVEYAHDHGVVVEGELGTWLAEDDVKSRGFQPPVPKRWKSSSARRGPLLSPSAPPVPAVHRRPGAPATKKACWSPAPALRYPGGDRPAARLPHRPRLLFRAPGIREDHNEFGGQDARCGGHPRVPAAPCWAQGAVCKINIDPTCVWP